jgi:hypothetical protein
MSSIFISYRRAGTSGYGGRLQEDLRHHFGRGRVFRDIDSIRPGSDFAQVIDQAVARSGIVLALIGSSWLQATNERGQRRLDDPDDFVRLEIEAALKQGIVVIPVLVEGARVPSPGDLPPSISRLGRTQGIELTDERWDYDLSRLIGVLEEVVGVPSEPTLDRTAAGPAAWSTASQPAAGVGIVPPGPAGAPGASDTTAAAPVVGGPPAPGPAEPATVPPPAPPPAVGPDRLVRDRRLVAAAVVSVVVLLVLGVLVGVSRGRGPARRAVPGVVDRDVAAATLALRTAGFVVETETKPEEARPGGIVVAQDPAGGASVKKGATVRLSVSGNTGKLAVPSVVNLNRTDAVAAIEAAGLVANVVEQRNDGTPAGTVFVQSPDPTTAVDKGATVTITVSTGTAPPASAAPGAAAGAGAATGAAGGQAAAPATTRATAPPATAAPGTLPPISTGNLVTNPGAEASAASAPFTVGQAPAGWQRGALQPIAAAYGASGQR